MAQPLDAEQLAVVVNELETTHQFVSPAKDPTARRRMSRSASNPRTRALNCLLTASTVAETYRRIPGDLTRPAPARPPASA